MTRRRQRTLIRAAAAELAEAIRSGDSARINHSQRELGRVERATNRLRRRPS